MDLQQAYRETAEKGSAVSIDILADVIDEGSMFTKTMKLGRRGKRLWLRIPAAIVRDRNLKPGDEAQFTQIGEHEFELSRVGESGIVEKILTLRRVMPPEAASFREEGRES